MPINIGNPNEWNIDILLISIKLCFKFFPNPIPGSKIIFSFSQGIKIFRVHNVEEVKQGLLVFETLLNKWKKNILALMV